MPIGEVEPFSSRQGIGAMLVELLYRPLLRFSEDGQLKTDMAEKVWWEEQDKSFHVKLSPENAENVKFTLEHLQKLGIPEFKEGLKNLVSFDIKAPGELVFRLKEYDRIFPFMLSRIPILSKDPAQTTGDFVIESKKDDSIVLQRKVPSPTSVNRIVVRQIPSARRVLREFATGSVDITFLTDEGDSKVLSDLPQFAFGELESAFLYLVLINRENSSIRRMPWSEISKNLHRDRMISELGAKGLSPAYIPVRKVDRWGAGLMAPAGQPSEIEPFKVMSVPKAAIELSLLNTQAMDARIALLLKRHLEEMGIPISLNYLEPQNFGEKILKAKDFDLVLLPFAIRDALTSNYFVFHTAEGAGSVNLSGYSSPEVDKFLEAARYQYDDERAKEDFSKAIAEMLKDPPGIFLFWLKTPLLYRKSCTGFKFNTNEFFSSLKDVRCEPSAAN
ncbi:MAG TPA: hypothetical protein VJR29_06140 [bacterium]|nr:hypothetical protein [bacterium]